MRFFLYQALMISSLFALGAARSVYSIDSVESVSQIVQLLKETPTGQRLFQQAAALGAGDPNHWIRLGAVSKTDSVLTRTLNPLTGEEKIERELMILIRSTQGLQDAALNLAHELVHATEGKVIDPYDLKLSPGAYLKQSIEDVGGEIEAFKTECQVSREFQELKGWKSTRCARYIDAETGQLRADLIRKDFYRVGTHLKKVKALLGAEAELFSELSGQEPQLYSSTGQAPYPLALLREHAELTQAACSNSKRRLASLTTQRAGRSLASEDRRATLKEQTQRFLSNRCGEAE